MRFSCWECGEEKDIKHFTDRGVLYYEHCLSCIREDTFGPDEEEDQKKQEPKTQPKKEPIKSKTKPVSELSKLQKIRREFLSYNQKNKLEL